MDNAASGYEHFADKKTPPPDGLARLSEMAMKQKEAQEAVAKAEAALAKAKDDFKKIAEVEVPELMDSLSLSEFKTTDGLVVEVNEVIRASIPKARAPEAFAWLRLKGHEALIKREISVSFSRGEDEQAKKLLDLLAEQEFEPDDNESVHTQTLGAWVREKLEKGDEIPLDLFGVFRQRVASVSIPKVKVKK